MPTVSFVNMKGGVAKTTLATNVADCLARRFNKKILLIDLDPQFNATQCLVSGDEYVSLRNDGHNTIVDIFNDNTPSAVSIAGGVSAPQTISLNDIEPTIIKDNLHLLFGALELYRTEMTAGSGREQRLKRYLDLLNINNGYDIIIIDTPPTPSAWMMSALLASSHFVVPVKPEPLSRTGIDLLRSVIDRCSENYGHPLTNLGVVLTIAEESTIVYRDTKNFLDNSSIWSGKRFSHALPKRTGIARAQGEQNMILDMDDNAAKTALINITDEFLRRLET